jgi:glycosyltransferase involved in cell wall biosynthesis
VSTAVQSAEDHLEAATNTRSLNVVQLGKYFPPRYFGGIEVMTELSARALAGRYNVTVICHNTHWSRMEEVRDGYRLIRCGTQFKGFSQPISLMMGLELRRARPDLIQFHAPNFWGVLMVLLFCPRTPVIVTHHADVEGRGLLKRLLLPLYHRLLKRAICVHVNSLKNVQLSRDLPRQLARIAAIPHGIDECLYEVAEAERGRIAEQKRQRFGNTLLIGFVGRLVWYKGLQVLFQAAAGLPDISLIVIGDGPLRNSLQEQANALNMGDRVHFIGAVSHAEKVKYFHMMDMFVLPSTHITEAFGISQVEAQACGLPLISTDLPTGVSDVNVDGATGLVVPAGDVQGLRAAIERLANNKDLRDLYGARGRERAHDLFSERNYRNRLRMEVERAFARLPASSM